MKVSLPKFLPATARSNALAARCYMHAHKTFDTLEHNERGSGLKSRAPGRGLLARFTVRNGTVRTYIASVFVFALLVIGCATEVAHHTFLKQAYPPKPANHPIDVYTNSPPTRSFERVAILDAHCEAQGFMKPNLEQDAIPALKKAARAAGCDAIIEIQQRTPSNWTFETRVNHITAVGIIYK